MNGADVGMIGRRRGLRFADKALLGGIVVAPLRGQELQRDETIELGVARLIDHAHPAAAELGENGVLRNRFADEWVGNWPG